MDRIKGKTLGDEFRKPVIPETVLDALVDLQSHLQKAEVSVAWDLKKRFHDALEDNDQLSSDLKQELLEDLDALPDGQALCHCDFHADNVFFDGTKYTIIDLLQMSKGNPAADAASSYVSYCFFNLDLGKLYLTKYCTKSGIPRREVQKWLRVYAGTVLGQVPEQYTPILERLIAGDDAI